MNPSNSGGNDSQSLVIESLGKSFSGLRALDNVSFSMRQGEILGVIGPNGSGKTTLINVVTGLLPATDGKVKVCGKDITNQHSYNVAKAGISRTFQTIRLFRELTVFQNAEVAAISMGIRRKEARERAANALKVMGIERWADQSAGGLPYGHERRAEIARALSMSPKFLLLDEPAAGLNEDESDELLSILTPLPQKMNLGMLIVEHDMRLIMRLCHRLHVLNYGRTIGEGTPEEIRKIPAVIQAYLGKNKT